MSREGSLTPPGSSLFAALRQVQRGDDGTGGWSRRIVEFAEAITAEVQALAADRDEARQVADQLRRHGCDDLAARYRELERAYRQACTNLATIRPSGLDASLGEDAQRYYDALLAGWGGIEGWDDRDATVFAWLIERGQPERQEPTVWVDEIRERDGWFGWTTDANKALRFATKDLAEVVIKQHLMSPREPGATARAVEHGFMGTR